jgi:hypothetical protein
VLAATLAAGAVAAVPAVAEVVAPRRAAPTTPAAVAPVTGRGDLDTEQVALSPATVPAPDAGGAARSAVADGPAAGTAGWSTVVDLRDGTQMVALTWDGGRSGPDGPASGRLSLRWSSAGAGWSGWLDVAPDPDDQGGEGHGRVGSEVVWLGSDGADRLEVRVDAGPLVDLQLLRMHYEEEPAGAAVASDAGASARAATGRAALPAIQPRSAWTTAGWQSTTSGCGSTPSVASSLQHAVVHHTASTNSYTQAQVPGLIESIRQYHTAGLGWCDIAYNFVVDRFGTIWQGRAGDITKPVIGGHAKGFNTGSVGVTLLGQFEPGASPTAAQPTLAMLDSTARLLAWKLDLHGLAPKGTTTVTSGGSTRYAAGVRVTLPIINAHRDHSLTACPGANVVSVMGAIRDLAADHSTGTSSTTTTTTTTTTTAPPPPARDWTPFSSAEELTYRQFVDVLRSPGTWEDRRWWNDALNAGTTNRNALVFSLVRSSRSEERSASVVRLYLAYFDRAPDHSGLAHWFGRMDAGEGIRHVSAAFARSPEFTSRYGSLTDEQFVRLVYANVLGRSPDADGFAYWTGRLRSRSESRGGLMALFSESGEYRALTRDATDVVLVHDAMLGRAASTATMDTWVARIEGDSSIATLISQLFASAEYAARVG